MEGGRTVADVFFGDISSAGKLPLTFPKLLDDLPPIDDYIMDNRTYRYASTEPLYPFDFGMSYNTFKYADLKLDKSEIVVGDTVDVGLIVTNTGGRTASEVAQFYLSDLEASTLIPLQKLIDFERVTPKPGESQTLEFTITPEIMSFFNEDGMLTLEPGEFRLEVGSCSPGKRGQELDVPAPVTAVFKVI